MRVSLLSYKMPEIPGPQHGVFANLPRHEVTHDKRFLESTYYDAYQKQFDQQRYRPTSVLMLHSQKISAGTGSSFEPVNRIRITTKLISEKYNNNDEPKDNTEAQRSWIYHRDGAIKAIEDYHIDNTKTIHLPIKDNELSFPINNKKEYGNTLSKSINGCPKRLTDITKTTYHIANLRK